MEADYLLHCRVLRQHALFPHHFGPCAALLCRLKDQANGSLYVLLSPLEYLGGGQEHRRVPIVATRMHAPIVGRSEIDGGLFVDGQRINVRSQRHTWRLSRAQISNHPCFALWPVMDVPAPPLGVINPHLCESLFDVGRRLMLGEHELGDLMQVPPPVDGPLMDAFRLAKQICERR